MAKSTIKVLKKIVNHSEHYYPEFLVHKFGRFWAGNALKELHLIASPVYEIYINLGAYEVISEGVTLDELEETKPELFL